MRHELRLSNVEIVGGLELLLVLYAKFCLDKFFSCCNLHKSFIVLIQTQDLRRLEQVFSGLPSTKNRGVDSSEQDFNFQIANEVGQLTF